MREAPIPAITSVTASWTSPTLDAASASGAPLPEDDAGLFPYEMQEYLYSTSTTVLLGVLMLRK
jgi:hypothetical protein